MGYTHYDGISANIISTGRKGYENPVIRSNSSRNYCRQLIRSVTSLADANTTLTAAQVLDSGVFTITPTVARTITTPTAASIVAAMPQAKVGDSFMITIAVLAAFAVTLAGGTGVTVTGGNSANNSSMTFIGVITNVTSGSEAVTFVRM